MTSEKEIVICPITAPCKGCSKRHESCHSSCPEYAKYREKCEEFRQERVENAETTSGIMETRDRVRRIWVHNTRLR